LFCELIATEELIENIELAEVLKTKITAQKNKS